MAVGRANPVPPSLPWLASPFPNDTIPEPSDTPPPPAPPPGAPIVLRPAPPPNDSVEDITPGSEIPSPFRFLHPAGDPDHLADHLLVVYNLKDPDSKALADYYALRRKIPPERVLGIACPLREEITRAEYDQTIREPVLGYLFQHGWMTRESRTVRLRDQSLELLAATRNDIWAIVLMRGIPLKVAASAQVQNGMQTAANLATNAAAVDSELAMLPVFGLPLGGFAPNPFFDLSNSGELRAGPELATLLILVTRLDAPTPGCVRRMIDDTLTAESQRLAGAAVIDSRGLTDVTNGYTKGDLWLREARDLLIADGWSVAFDDRPDTLPATDPVDHVALYYGWYATNARGPWTTPPRRFVPGAIAYHLHSFSADTLRSPTRNWAGPLLENGAAATMGAVYEPYLMLTPHLDIFTRRLLDGDSFAEAAYASQVALSWMVTVVGDPLYRPFEKPVDEALTAAGPAMSDRRDWLLLQKAQRRLAIHPVSNSAGLCEALDIPGAGALVHERLGDLLQKVNDPPAAEKAYSDALRLTVEPLDSIRIGLKLAQEEVSQNQDALAEKQLRSLQELYPSDAPRFGVSEGMLPTGSR